MTVFIRTNAVLRMELKNLDRISLCLHIRQKNAKPFKKQKFALLEQGATIDTFSCMLFNYIIVYRKKPLLSHSHQLQEITKELIREVSKETNSGVEIDILYRRLLAKKKVIQ